MIFNEKKIKLKNKIVLDIKFYENKYILISYVGSNIQILDMLTLKVVKEITSKKSFQILECYNGYLYAAEFNKIRIYNIGLDFKFVKIINSHSNNIQYLKVYNSYLLSFSFKNLIVYEIEDKFWFIKTSIYIENSYYSSIICYKNIVICILENNSIKLFDINNNFKYIGVLKSDASNIDNFHIYYDTLICNSENYIKTFDIENKFKLIHTYNANFKINKLKIYKDFCICSSSDLPNIFILSINDSFNIIYDLNLEKIVNNITITNRHLIIFDNGGNMILFSLLSLNNLEKCNLNYKYYFMNLILYLHKEFLDFKYSILNHKNSINSNDDFISSKKDCNCFNNSKDILLKLGNLDKKIVDITLENKNLKLEWKKISKELVNIKHQNSNFKADINDIKANNFQNKLKFKEFKNRNSFPPNILLKANEYSSISNNY